MIPPAAAGMVTITGIGAHDAGIREKQMPQPTWSRSPESVVTFIGIRSHDIPEHKIRERWVASRANLIRLLPALSRLQVFDNSADVAAGQEIPAPLLVLEVIGGNLVFPEPDNAEALADTPAWARPIVQAAHELLS